WSSTRLERLDATYQRALTWALGHRKTVLGGVAGLLVLTLGLVPFIGTEFFPPSDESQFIIRMRAPVGTRVEETERIVQRMERITRAPVTTDELSSIVSTVGVPSGRSGLFSTNTGPHAAQVQVY